MTWFHACGHRHHRCCPVGEEGAGGPLRSRPFTMDLHCHAVNPQTEALVADRAERQAELTAMARAAGPASTAHNQQVMLPAAFPKLTRLSERLADMDRMGIDVQVVSPSPHQYCYWADPTLAEVLVATQNEHIADLCKKAPDRITGLGTVALQHPALAARQLSHAVGSLGLRGVEISTSVNGLRLDDTSLEPFWTAAERLGAVVFLHPLGSTLGDRANTHYLDNIVGQPLETTLALSHLIFGGVLDRHPGLKLVAAHGGGYLPTAIGRSNWGHRVRPEAAANAVHAPVDYLKRIWFDTVVHDPLALRHLIDVVGVSQVVAGTDYPFDMGEPDLHGLLQAVEGLSEAERAAILGRNAANLLGWGPVQPTSAA